MAQDLTLMTMPRQLESHVRLRGETVGPCVRTPFLFTMTSKSTHSFCKREEQRFDVPPADSLVNLPLLLFNPDKQESGNPPPFLSRMRLFIRWQRERAIAQIRYYSKEKERLNTLKAFNTPNKGANIGVNLEIGESKTCRFLLLRCSCPCAFVFSLDDTGLKIIKYSVTG